LYCCEHEGFFALERWSSACLQLIRAKRSKRVAPPLRPEPDLGLVILTALLKFASDSKTVSYPAVTVAV
jgi:hypothetical protein